MLDLGWSELLVVAVLTVLIFGPKELPTVLRTVTQFVNKARGMARDFQRTMDDVAREAELDKLKDEVKDATNANSMLDPTGTENNMFDNLFDDDEEVDGTPVNRKSTAPVPGFDSAKDKKPAEGPASEPPAPEAQAEPGDAPSPGQAPAPEAGGEAAPAEQKKASG
ncbi:MAG: Sec-independent protein translocase protein TatB [Minwuia sp.]|uniref:Sec-independent protein translocase protein TatB n=1 Tax=Minwuia sp. TaxID=2493630 RepID=UPI003A87966B